METRKTTALTTVLTGLRRYTNYSMQVLAFTRIGDGVLTQTSHCRTEEDGIKIINDSFNIYFLLMVLKNSKTIFYSST